MELPREADTPFNSSARADIILRSSDNVDFYAMKSFLAFASSVFESMFSLPQSQKDGGGQTVGSLPVIELQEECKFIRNLLLHCYPGVPPVIEDADDIITTIVVAEKYAMDDVQKQLRTELLASPAMTRDPLRIFAVAFHHGWEEVARFAARKTLDIHVTELPFSPELDYLTGSGLYRLFEYRYRCARRIRQWMSTTGISNPDFSQDKSRIWYSSRDASTDEYIWREEHGQCKSDSAVFAHPSLRAHPDDRSVRVTATTWWTAYFTALLARLDACPSGNIVLDNNLSDEALTAASRCRTCARDAHRHLDNFKKELAEAIDKVVSEVVLEIQFSNCQPTEDSGK
ncbi:hypothetical protein BDZ97DRAFT_1803205 [Flammula alnicola]|nr:hypothetical protein BDZ97DRAFT_1803205 [Flammula alnicola]